jgi:hypothetical protein
MTADDEKPMTEALVGSGRSLLSVTMAVGHKGPVVVQMHDKAAKDKRQRRLNAGDDEAIEKMMLKSNGDKTAFERELLNYFEEVLVRPQDAVDWLHQKIAELE